LQRCGLACHDRAADAAVVNQCATMGDLMANWRIMMTGVSQRSGMIVMQER
jgi:hypothetical protein